MTPSLEAVVRALAAAGSTTGEVAQALGCSPSAAAHRLQMLRARGDIEMLTSSAGKLVWRRAVTAVSR